MNNAAKKIKVIGKGAICRIYPAKNILVLDKLGGPVLKLRIYLV